MHSSWLDFFYTIKKTMSWFVEKCASLIITNGWPIRCFQIGRNALGRCSLCNIEHTSRSLHKQILYECCYTSKTACTIKSWQLSHPLRKQKTPKSILFGKIVQILKKLCNASICCIWNSLWETFCESGN